MVHKIHENFVYLHQTISKKDEVNEILTTVNKSEVLSNIKENKIV